MNFEHGISGATLEKIIKQDGKAIVRKRTVKDIFKLIDQFNWLQNHQSLSCIPEVLKGNYTNDVFYYDMKLYDSSKTLDLSILGKSFDFKKLSSSLINTIKKSFYKKPIGASSETLMKSYVDTKLQDKIKHTISISPRLKDIFSKELVVNDIQYHSMEKYVDHIQSFPTWLKEISLRNIYDIHGDLTAENILVDGDLNFIFIDPNGGNIFSTISCDIAKLYQSFYCSYELLRNSSLVSKGDGKYSYSLNEQSLLLYKSFLNELDLQIKDKFDLTRKEIVFHCFMHMVRLLPYQSMLNPEQVEIYYIKALELGDELYNE